MKKMIVMLGMISIFSFMLMSCTQLVSISFDSNGGTAIESRVIRSEGDRQLPYDPIRDGYTFVGWFDNDQFEGDIVTYIDATSNTTYYAKWELNSYDVYYQIVDDGYNEDLDVVLHEDEIFTDLKLGRHVSIALTNQDRLFAWGDNTNHKILCGDVDKVLKPRDITFKLGLKENEKINYIEIAHDYLFMITDQERLLQLGGSDGVVDLTSQINLREGEHIAIIKTGKYQHGILTTDHRLYLWGIIPLLGNSNYHDNLILVNDYAGLEEDEIIENFSIGTVDELVIITSHDRVLNYGDVYYFGFPTQSGSLEDFTSQLQLGEDEHISNFYSGDGFYMLTTDQGRIISFGRNQYGQLGSGGYNQQAPANDMTEFIDLNNDEVIQDISLGVRSSFLLTSKGRVFGWGSNENHQILGKDSSTEPYPVDMTAFINLDEYDSIKHLTSGYSHAGVITRNGEIITWGSNAYGQLGNSLKTYSHEAKRINTYMFDTVKEEQISFNENLDEFIPQRDGYVFDG